MRVAVATRTRAHVGGIETYIDLSAAGLRTRGHDVEVLTEDRAGLRALHDALLAFEPDVVLSHGLMAPALETAIVDAWPTVFFAHVYHGTCVGGAKAYSFPHPAPCSRPLGVGCLVRYYPRRCGGWSPMTMLRQFDVQRQRLAAISRCRAIVALSEHVVREYAQHGIAADRLHVLPPVVRDVAPATRGQPPDPPHVVYVGRLERLKGPGVLMDALGPAADRLGSRLVATFAGEGSYAQALAAKAREVRRQWPAVDVRLVGKLPTDAVDALFAGASLVGVPSLWPEPFGLVGLEAGCFGVPAVAFRSGGIPEWLKDGTNGRLAVVHGSAASLADAIASVLSDSEGYLRLRAGARAEAQRATRNTHLAQLEAVLRDAAVAPHESPRLAPSAPDERF